MLDRLRQDVRYAARALSRSPVFALVSVVSIAIGIGATTAIVTLANALLFRPPPGVGHPERLVVLARTQDGHGFDTFSYPNFQEYRAARSLSGAAALDLEPKAVSLMGPNGGEPIQVMAASGNLFEVLEARASLGRFFTTEDDRVPGGNPVVVLNHTFWSRRFNSDSGIVGRTIVLNRSPFTVIGVAQERFQGPFVIAPDAWVPLAAGTLLGTPPSIFSSRGSVWLIAIARLAPDIGVSQAQAELSTIAERQAQDDPEANRGHGVAVTRASLFPADLQGPLNGFMAMLLAITGLVLVIASINVAGMLLARAAQRRREIAVRLALGASRAQLVMQLVIESLLLFVVAGAAGLVLARWLVAGLLALVPRLPVQLTLDPRLDWRVLGFALVLSLVTGLAAGVVPALQSTRPDLVPSLKSGESRVGRRPLRLRSGLLVTQIAFSMLLLMVAVLFARTLAHARGIDPGFEPRDVSIASIDLGLSKYEDDQGRRVAGDILDHTRSLPGVRSAALSAMLPLDGSAMGLGEITVPGREPPDPRQGWRADWNVVTPGYFATLSIPIVRGRDFSDADRPGTSDVAILNESFAAALFPDEDPIGRTLTNEGKSITVIGVARNAKYRSLGEPPINFIYVTLSQRYFSRIHLLIKTVPGAAAPGAAVRRIVAGIDPSLPILRQQSMVEQTAMSLFPQRLALYVSGGLGAVALLLVLIGIYGVTAFTVAQRTQEIGVRVALGAQRSHVQAMVVRQGLVLVGIGVTLGSLAAFAVTRLIRDLLYGVPATDSVAFGSAAALLVFAALVASWVPARRAARLDPVIALRTE